MLTYNKIGVLTELEYRMEKLYEDRKLEQGYPAMEKLYLDAYITNLQQLEQEQESTTSVNRLMIQLGRLVDPGELKDILVLGCGPQPLTVKTLVQKNYNAVGVEPVNSFVRSAEKYLASLGRVLEGSAEAIPLPSNSQDLILCEGVLEHVDSPTKSLDEIFRVLRPGGIVYIHTTNRHRISLKGANGEYNVRYYNWLPDIVKESFVFHHLHYDPSLANYTLRPAVHWYSYSDLCKLGRQAGFYQFYSILDLQEMEDLAIAPNRVQKLLLKNQFLWKRLKFNPWLRSLALTQTGSILMLKRR
jgi:ubiquinone/menaquinone biosynthesis C-methylase UbiE